MPRKQEYFCGLCNLPYDTFTQFEEHHWSMLHHRQLENKRKVKRHFCTLCKQMWPTLPEYGVHLIGERHKNAVRSWSMRQKNTDHKPNVPSRGSSLQSHHQRRSFRPSENRSRSFMRPTSMPEDRPYENSSSNRILPLASNRYHERRISTSFYYRPPHSRGFPRHGYSANHFTSGPWYAGNMFNHSYPDGLCHNVEVGVSSSIMTRSSFVEDSVESETSFKEDPKCTANQPGDLYEHINSPMTDTYKNSSISSPRDNFSLLDGIHPLARNSPLDKNSQRTGTDKEKYDSAPNKSTVTDPQPSTSHNHNIKRTRPSIVQNEQSLRKKNTFNKAKESSTKGAKSDRRSSRSDGQSKVSKTQVESFKGQMESSTIRSESSSIGGGPPARYTAPSAMQRKSSDTETLDRLHEPQIGDTSTRENEMFTTLKKLSGRQNQAFAQQSKSSNSKNKSPTKLAETSDRQSKTSEENESSTTHSESSAGQNEFSTRHSESPTRHEESSTRHNESSTRHNESSTRHNVSSTRHNESSTRHNVSSTTPDEMTVRQSNPSDRQDELSVRQNNPSDRQSETSTKQSEHCEHCIRPAGTSTRQNKPSTGQSNVLITHTETPDSQIVALSSSVSESYTKKSQPSIDQTDHLARQTKFSTFCSNPSVRQIVSPTSMNQNKLESQRNEGQEDLQARTGAENALKCVKKESTDDATTGNCNIKDVECDRASENSYRQFERVICKEELVESADKSSQVKAKNDEDKRLSSMQEKKMDFSKGAQSTSTRNTDQSESRCGRPGIAEGMVVEIPSSMGHCPPQETSKATDIRPKVQEGNCGEDSIPSHRGTIASGQRPSASATNHSAEVTRMSQSLSKLRSETNESSEQVIQPCTKNLPRFVAENVPSKSVPEQGMPSCSVERVTNSKLLVTSIAPSVSTTRQSPLRGNRSSACGTDAGDILLHELIRKHLEKLQRCRTSRPNLTSSRVQHYPSQHADATLSDLKQVLLHLFERPMSSSRKKLQEVQLRKLLAKASDSSERFKRFGVHLETFDRNDDEMIKLLETLTEEDLELLSKEEDSKKDLKELLSLFELAEDPSTNENVQVARQMTRDGGATEPEEVLSMSDSSSDVELIESAQSEVIVLSEDEVEEDEQPLLKPPEQSQPEPANALHDQVFQLSLKEREFSQKLKAMRKEQKTLEANIKRDTANLARLKKSREEMKKQVKALRKNRLKLTKGHSVSTSSSDLQTPEFGGSSSTLTDNQPLANSDPQHNVTVSSSPANYSKPYVQGPVGSAGVTTQSEISAPGNVPISTPLVQHNIFSSVKCKSESETSVGQSSDNQMVGQFSIPPSAMGISIQRISEEDVLLLTRQEALRKDLQSQVCGSSSTLNLDVDPSVQISSSAPGTTTQCPSIHLPTQQPVQLVNVASIGSVGGTTQPVSQNAIVKQLNNSKGYELKGNNSQAADVSKLSNHQISLLKGDIRSENPNIVKMNQEKFSTTEKSRLITNPVLVQVVRSKLLGHEGVTTSQTTSEGNVEQPPSNCIPDVPVTQSVEHSQPAKGISRRQAGGAVPLKEASLATSSSAAEENIQQGGTLDSKSSISGITKEAPLSTQLDTEGSSVASPCPASISKVQSSASLEEDPVQGSATNRAIVKEEPLEDQLSITQENEADSSGLSRNKRKSLPDTNASKTDPPPQSSEEDGASSIPEQARCTRLRTRDTFMKQYSCKRKRQLSPRQLTSSKKREPDVRSEKSGSEDDSLGSKRIQPKVVLTRLKKSEEPLPVANKSTDKNLRSQRRRNAISSECSLRSHNDPSGNGSSITSQSNGSQKARHSTPAPNIKKGHVRLTQKESSLDNPLGLTDRKGGKTSPYSFENMQRRVTEEERRHLGLLTSQLISKHLKAVKRYQTLGLSDFFIQIARKGKVASKQEIAMLKKEAKRVKRLRKREGNLETATEPDHNPTGAKSIEEKRELRLRKKVEKKEERLELFRTFGMSEEFLAIMAKGGKATKKEQSDLSREMNKKHFMEQYRAAKKCSRRLGKEEKMEQRRIRQRMSSAARNQLDEYILSTMETDVAVQPNEEEASRNPQTRRRLRNRKNDMWKSKGKTNQQLLPDYFKTAVIGLGVVGDKLYSCSVSGSVKVYNSKTLNFEASYSGHQSGVTGLHVHQDDNSLMLFTCSQDHYLQCRTICNSKMTVQRLDLHHPVTSMVAADESLFLALANGCVDVLNIKEFKCYQSFTIHNHEIRSLTVACFEGEKYLVTGTHNAELSARSITGDNNLQYSLEGHRSSILCIQVAGKYVLSGSSDCRLLQHDFSTKEFVMEYTSHTRAITDMKVHQSMVYTACLDDTIRMINFQKMELTATFFLKNALSLCKIAQNVYVGTTDGKVEKLSYLPACSDDDYGKENGESESNKKVALVI